MEQISTIVKMCGLLYINDEYGIRTSLYRRAKKRKFDALLFLSSEIVSVQIYFLSKVHGQKKWGIPFLMLKEILNGSGLKLYMYKEGLPIP